MDIQFIQITPAELKELIRENNQTRIYRVCKGLSAKRANRVPNT